MIRKYFLIALIFVATTSIPLDCVEARNISRKNPYRTFNLSGRNYGSLRWEQRNRRKAVIKKPVRRYRVYRSHRR
jgi:hypothetical protein